MWPPLMWFGLGLGEAIMWLLVFIEWPLIEWPLIMAWAVGLGVGDAAAMFAARIRLSMAILRRYAAGG